MAMNIRVRSAPPQSPVGRRPPLTPLNATGSIVGTMRPKNGCYHSHSYASRKEPSISSVVSESSSSSGSTTSNSGSRNSTNDGRPALVAEGRWKRTEKLLIRRRGIEKKLKKALVGCARESKRLNKMEGDVRSLEQRELSIYTNTSSASSTTTTRTSRSKMSAVCADDKSHDSAVRLLESCYLPTKYDEGVALPAMISAAQSDNISTASISSRSASVSSGHSRSMIYEEVKKLSNRCDKLQQKLETKDGEIKQLDNDKKSVIRRFREAREHHADMRGRYEAMFQKMCIKQCEEISRMNATIEDKDRQINECREVIRQLLDANEKLEIALQAMTKVAEDELKSKKQVREDLKKLKSNHLKDLMKKNGRNQRLQNAPML